MTLRLEGITVLADDVPAFGDFLERALGIAIVVREEHYLACEGSGVRLAVFSRRLMSPNTDDHPSYRAPRSGQAFELNFQCDDADEVISRYRDIIAAGGSVVGLPAPRAWGHFTGFFADPEGNIHSLFAETD